MSDVEDYEYDLAVSFAGEERAYVEAVVRGLGSDATVFYDADKKAELLGENLIDVLTELYQNKARYVAMFISSSYATKMWPNVERQSAMARAATQRSAYILPVRMDDAILPGLLPTIGFIDARVEGLDGITEIISTKLGLKRVSARYRGRVPATRADIELLVALQPDFWEYWLYAGELQVGLDCLREKYRDYELSYAVPTGEVYFGHEAFDFLRKAPLRVLHLIRNFENMLTHDVQERAFGLPGESGDLDLIVHTARRLIETYEGLLDEASRVRGAALPEEFKQAQQAASEFGSDAVDQFRSLVGRCVGQFDQLPELVERHTDETPLNLVLAFEVTLDEEVSRRFTEGLQEGLASLTE